MQTPQFMGLLAMLIGVSLLTVLVPKFLRCQRALMLLKEVEQLKVDREKVISECENLGKKIGLHNDLRRTIMVGLTEFRSRSARQTPIDACRSEDANDDQTDLLNALFGDGTARSSKRTPTQVAPSVEDIWVDRTPRPKRGCVVYLHRFEFKEIPALLEFSLENVVDRKPDNSSRIDVFIELKFASLEQLEYPNSDRRARSPVVHWSTVLEIIADPSNAVSQATYAAKTWANQAIEGSHTDINGILTPRELASLVEARRRELGWACHFNKKVLRLESELLSIGVR